ncbi:MAG TPA: DUF4832 domain-containing protein [Verrucomicrobiae bacterium]|nr:DUF4832 domain-containing protein [Verrucomicrobiae bacterium]
MRTRIHPFRNLLALATIAAAASTFAGTFHHIEIDGSFADWADVPLAYHQPQDVTNVVAYENVYLANDDDYLYIRFSLHEPADPFTALQNIFVDADHNAATGFNAHDLIGSEMVIQSGAGYQEKNGGFNEGAINGLGWLSAPTGAANKFEMRISRNATFASNGERVFSGNTMALVFEAETNGFVSVEWVPPFAGGLTYTFVESTNAVPSGTFATNFYSVSDEDFANPERGFYIQADSYASAPTPVPGNLASYRTNGRNSPGNTYNAKISLLLRLYYLDTFVNAPISSSFLNSIQADFDSIRAQGFKVILRFAYNQDQTRPFNEPTKDRILSHIEQLKPLLQKNSDVIAVVQQGFIAAWGEGYFTDIFYTNGAATAQNWIDRSQVLGALLDALPTNRMVQVRTPQMKQKYVYGHTAPTGAAALDPTQAFSGADAARIGFHNDCFLADATDAGTYSDYDVANGTSQQDILNLRNYVALDSRFTPVGGETCVVNPPTDDCESVGGSADPNMATAHYSFLNQGYNADVNDKWAAHGCIDDIKRRLGYRLELLSGIFRTEAQPGQAIPFQLTFRNVGFAAPFNPRGMEIVFRNTSNGQKYFATLSREADPRRWLPGTNYTVNARLALPSEMAPGEYELLLNLPDPEPSLYNAVPYSIRLANSNALSNTGAVLGQVWEPSTGYHRLGRTVFINSTATNAAPAGDEIPVLNFSTIAETYETWKTRHFQSDPEASAPSADPDADSRVNLLEYAIGSNPNVAESNNYLHVSYADDALLLSVAKGPGVKDVNYEVQSSPALAPESWSEDSISILQNDDSMFRVSYSGLAFAGFLRLKLTLK